MRMLNLKGFESHRPWKGYATVYFGEDFLEWTCANCGETGRWASMTGLYDEILERSLLAHPEMFVKRSDS